MNTAPAAEAADDSAPPARFDLHSNQSLLCHAPDRAWVVESGSLELLSTRIDDDDAPVGNRRHLFQVATPRAVFGSQPDATSDRLGFIAIAGEPCRITDYPLARIAEALDAGDSAWRARLTHWVKALGGFVADQFDAPGTLTRLEPAADLEFGQEEAVSPAGDGYFWLTVHSGALTLFGQPHLRLEPEHGPLLASSELWLQVASEQAQISLQPAAAGADSTNLAAGLDNLHRLVHHRLHLLGVGEDDAERKRRQESRKRLALQSADAHQELAAVLNPSERFKRREDDLLTAASIIGQVLGITINPPAKSEDMKRVSTPLEAIARASRVRWRKIILNPAWWQYDSGPLLAYLGEEERQPVALLPHRSGYQIVDPRDCRRRPLTDEQRERVCPDVYMLYRALPDRVRGVLDLLKFTSHGRVGDLLFILLMGICATLLGMIVPKATGTLIDDAIPSADRRLLYELALILTVAGIAGAIFTFVQVITTVRTSINSEVIAQAAMWDRLLKFKPSFFRQYSSGDLQTRVNAVSEISRELSGATLRPMISGVLALLNLLLLWYYSWDLAKIAIWVGLGVMLLTLTVSYFIRRLSFRLHDLEGEFNGLMIQMIGGVGKLRVAGSEHRAFNYWVEKYTEQLTVTLKIQRLKDLIQVFNLILPPLASALLFWKAVDLTIGLPIGDENRISMGDFIAFNTAFVLYLTGWSDVSNTLVSVLDAVVKGRRIKPILDADPEVPKDAADPGRLSGRVVAENLTFRYIDDGPLILDKVSFQINPGEFVAFVGASGSGKSTILRLLLGFEQPEYGRILYDGHDLSGIDVMAVRRQIGTVLQNGRLNAGNLLENISNNAQITHGEAWDAAADAGLTADIEKMPMGLHTMVAEGGANLSGGQRQRLLIARALATRPKIVFFDEATSALDNKTQATVSEALERRRVTRVAIAHRLSTIRKADRIYVLQNGRIMQSGGFEQLAGQDGLFKELMSRQMA